MFWCATFLLWNNLSVSCFLLLPSALTIDFLFLLLNLRPAEHGIISSSSSPREQNVALGIKLFNYSVSYRLANLTLSLPAPWPHLRYVCLHIGVCAACVGVFCCSCVCVCVSAHREWLPLEAPLTVISQPLVLFMHALVCVSHITRCHFLWGIGESSQLPFFSLSMLTSGGVSRSAWQSKKVVFYKVLRGFWDAQWQQRDVRRKEDDVCTQQTSTKWNRTYWTVYFA